MIFHEVKDPASFWKFTMESDDVLALECAIVEAGDGDYLEIGTQQGGSACFVGKVKKMLGHSGRLYGVDSLQNRFADKDKIEQYTKEFGVDFTLIVDVSDHAVLPEKCHPVVTLIDGDHYGDMPVRDWNNLKDRTKRFILFHDCNEGSDVERAVENAKADTSWTFVGKSGCMAVFERCGSS